MAPPHPGDEEANLAGTALQHLAVSDADTRHLSVSSGQSEKPGDVRIKLLELADKMSKSHQTYFKRFEMLYVYNILQYQYELSKLEKELSEKDQGEESHLDQTKRLRALLSEYNSAIQDAQSVLTMRTVPAEYSKIMLLAQSARIPDSPPQYRRRERLLALDVGLSTGLLDVMSTTSAFLGDKPYIHSKAWQTHASVRWWNSLVSHSWDAMIRTGWFGRFVFGVVGGAFLVVPMVGMLYSGSREAHLGIVVGSIVIFVTMMAVVTRGSMQDIFGATAGYAAVLVVFVGVRGGDGV